MKRYECDLHCHSTRSDGNDSPKELIDNAASLGMRAIAIVDHDIDPPLVIALDDGREIDILSYAKGKGLELILGYEFSCDTNVDDVHIIGYRCEWRSKLIQDEVQAAEDSKVYAYRDLCEVLTRYGMPIDYENEVLTYTQDGEVKHRLPKEVQRKHIFELMAQKGYTRSWDEAKILVRDDPRLNVKRKKIDPIRAIGVIHGSSGIAVLAHPHLIDEEVHPQEGLTFTRDEYIEKLLGVGLDGIESSYTYDKTTYKGSLTKEQIKYEVEEKYRNRVKFFTGGSDYHNDSKKGVENPRYIGEAGISFDEFKKIFY
ncbi:MAG: PHP domain-containing protein [Actinobacteria bacterium]|nr:PHP domain-containing protein [Actinomycetota bacterium]